MAVAAAAGRRARRPIRNRSVPSAPTVPPPRRAPPLTCPPTPLQPRRSPERAGEMILNRWDFSTLALSDMQKYFYKTENDDEATEAAEEAGQEEGREA